MGRVVKNFIIALVPFLITAITLATVWWYVVIHQQAGAASGPVEGLQQLGSAVATPEATPAEKGPDFQFYLWFGISAARLVAVERALLLAHERRTLRGAQAPDRHR